jgi:hypothetical protein
MRQQGAVEEIRAILTAGIEEVSAANPGNFFRVSDKIVDNIDSAFESHREAISQLRRKKLRFWGHDIGTWIVSGAIEVAAALAGTPAFGLTAIAADQVFDAPKLRDVPKRFKDLREAQTQNAQSPLALLFKHRRKGS